MMNYYHMALTILSAKKKENSPRYPHVLLSSWAFFFQMPLSQKDVAKQIILDIT